MFLVVFVMLITHKAFLLNKQTYVAAFIIRKVLAYHARDTLVSRP